MGDINRLCIDIGKMNLKVGGVLQVFVSFIMCVIVR